MSEPSQTHLEQVEREALESAFRSIFATPEGKRVFFWILEQAAIYSDAYSGEDHATNYMLGQQAVGRKLIGMLDQLEPRYYPQLLLAMADLKAMDKAAAKVRADKDGVNDNDNPEFF